MSRDLQSRDCHHRPPRRCVVARDLSNDATIRLSGNTHGASLGAGRTTHHEHRRPTRAITAPTETREVNYHR